MAKNIIFALVSMLFMVHFASAMSYSLYTNHCTTASSPYTCTLSYYVNTSSCSTALMISAGYWGLANVSLPAGCTQTMRVDDYYKYSTVYFATCAQAPGYYSVTASGNYPSTYISEAAYVFPSSHTFAPQSLSGFSLTGPIYIRSTSGFSLCAGASGNGALQIINGTADVSDYYSAVWHSTGSGSSVCSDYTASPPLDLLSVGVY